MEDDFSRLHLKLDELLARVDSGFDSLQQSAVLDVGSHHKPSPPTERLIKESCPPPHDAQSRLGGLTGRYRTSLIAGSSASPKIFERRELRSVTVDSAMPSPPEHDLLTQESLMGGVASDQFASFDESMKEAGKATEFIHDGQEAEASGGDAAPSRDLSNRSRQMGVSFTEPRAIDDAPKQKQSPRRPHLPGLKRGLSTISRVSHSVGGFTRVVPEGQQVGHRAPPRRGYSEATLSPIESQNVTEVGTFEKLRQKTARGQTTEAGTRLSQLKWTLPGKADHAPFFSSMMDRFYALTNMQRCIAHRNETLRVAEKQQLYKFVHGLTWNGLCGFMILASTASIGISADSSLRAEVEERRVSETWAYVELAFSLFFIVELLVRFVAERLLFFIGPLWRWNLFDAVLVALSIFDLAMNGVHNEGGSNMTSARILRMTRSVRILRLVRTARDFQSLRVVVLAIIGSMISLVWTFLVVGFIIYIFAVFFLLAVHDHTLGGNVRDSATEQNLLDLYGSLYKCVVTLFATISGGIDWYDALRPLRALSWLYELVFLTYIFFMFFGVLNVVIGAFVAATAEAGNKDREAVISSQMNDLVRYTKKLKGVFMDADSDGSGTLSWEEFKDYLQHPKVKAYFQSFGLKVSEAHILFQLLDRDGSNKISVDEFLEGCWRLKGEARSIDVNMLLYMTEVLFNEVVANMEHMQRQINQVSKKLGLKGDDQHKGNGGQQCSSKGMARQGTNWFARFGAGDALGASSGDDGGFDHVIDTSQS